ncbi:MAG: hypothetical protein PVI57_03880 [Gemmatimonadota bacterium]|jgi:hypothetical protein
MASMPPGSLALLDPDELARLRFPPPTDEVVIAVHEGALKAPGNRLTLAACADEGEVVWVGAVDERMVLGSLGRGASLRPQLARRLFTGERCWSIVWPGHLLRSAGAGPRFTLYHGDRPWVVLGELSGGSLLAAPLNDASGSAKWYAPRIARGDLEGAAAKDGQLEMAHLWSLPRDLPAAGGVAERARPGLRRAVGGYYGARPPLGPMSARK